ncbi:MAG: PAS domain-containing protein, partial [Acidimicrobiia bacterium]
MKEPTDSPEPPDDSVEIRAKEQEQIYTPSSADRSYRLIVEAMNEGAATVAEDGLIVGANPHLATMLRAPRSHLIGARLTEMAEPEDRERLVGLLALSAGEASRGEVSLRRADGSLLPVCLSVSAFDLDGDLLRCVVLTDLTERRDAERRLRAAVAYNRSLIDSSLDPMMTIDREGVLTDVNDALVLATGRSRAALIGSPFGAHFTE